MVTNKNQNAPLLFLMSITKFTSPETTTVESSHVYFYVYPTLLLCIILFILKIKATTFLKIVA